MDECHSSGRCKKRRANFVMLLSSTMDKNPPFLPHHGTVVYSNTIYQWNGSGDMCNSSRIQTPTPLLIVSSTRVFGGKVDALPFLICPRPIANDHGGNFLKSNNRDGNYYHVAVMPCQIRNWKRLAKICKREENDTILWIWSLPRVNCGHSCVTSAKSQECKQMFSNTFKHLDMAPVSTSMQGRDQRVIDRTTDCVSNDDEERR